MSNFTGCEERRQLLQHQPGKCLSSIGRKDASAAPEQLSPIQMSETILLVKVDLFRDRDQLHHNRQLSYGC